MDWNILNQFKKELDLQIANILSTSYTQGEGIYRKFIYPKRFDYKFYFGLNIPVIKTGELCISVYIHTM